MKTLLLYGTLGCHLCEDAKVVLWPLLAEFGLILREVDIADDEAHQARYAIRIPVIALEGGASELGWPFDAESAREYLSKESALQA